MHLRINQIIAECIRILRSQDATSYIYKYAAAWVLGIDCVKHDALIMILINLEECGSTKEFMNLNASQICEILTASGFNGMKTNIQR
ncbi:BTB domain-containing protein [Caerostris darwini]|uniref:BTB domain-containing protein n=1 Tax=Caerostris darwini TaxID=1538125 RepID=A0AAV4X226_9ARAC|nr:BTB domain-containing protein [Caerostris darwini]